MSIATAALVLAVPATAVAQQADPGDAQAEMIGTFVGGLIAAIIVVWGIVWAIRKSRGSK
jgi:type IV secretory pathway VirB2 component (pilin)